MRNIFLSGQEALDSYVLILWLTAPWSEARELQWPAPADALVIVEKPATQIKFPAASPAQASLF